MHGYVITKEPGDARNLYDNDERVRFAAALADGTGIVAFDGDGIGYAAWGNVLMAQEPHPDNPDTWPDWAKKAAPKRAISTGREVYSLLPRSFVEYVNDQEAVTGCVLLDTGALLVESDGPIAGGDTWSVAVVPSSIRQRRTEPLELQDA